MVAFLLLSPSHPDLSSQQAVASEDEPILRNEIYQIAQEFYSEEELRRSRIGYASIIQQLKLRINPATSPTAAIQSINDYIFGEFGMAYEKSQDNIDNALVPSVIVKKQGNCIGIATLYLMIAEDLGLPLHGVAAPNHFFSRLMTKNGPINIELADDGNIHPDSDYVERYKIPEDLTGTVYLRTLSKRETLGYVRANLGVAFYKRGDSNKAISFFEASLKETGDQPDTYSNLGASYLGINSINKAVPNLKKAIAMWPTRASYHANLAQAYKDDNQKVLAVSEYETAIELDKSIEPLLRNNLNELKR